MKGIFPFRLWEARKTSTEVLRSDYNLLKNALLMTKSFKTAIKQNQSWLKKKQVHSSSWCYFTYCICSFVTTTLVFSFFFSYIKSFQYPATSNNFFFLPFFKKFSNWLLQHFCDLSEAYTFIDEVWTGIPNRYSGKYWGWHIKASSFTALCNRNF